MNIKRLESNGKIAEMSEYEYFCEKYGKEEVDRWIEQVNVEDLFWCLDTCSNDSFLGVKKRHRDKGLNKIDMILSEQANRLYPSSTYGTRPNETCKSYIGQITQQTYKNYDIAMFLTRMKISELKEWLLSSYTFKEQEKRLLYYYKGD